MTTKKKKKKASIKKSTKKKASKKKRKSSKLVAVELRKPEELTNDLLACDQMQVILNQMDVLTYQKDAIRKNLEFFHPLMLRYEDRSRTSIYAGMWFLFEKFRVDLTNDEIFGQYREGERSSLEKARNICFKLSLVEELAPSSMGSEEYESYLLNQLMETIVSSGSGWGWDN